MTQKKSLLTKLLGSSHKNNGEQEILSHAHKKAQHVVNQALEKADEILAQTELFTSELKSEVKKSWQATLAQNSQKLQKDAQEMMKTVLEEFRTELMANMKHSQELVQQKIAEEFAAIEASLKEYEKERQAEINEVAEKKVQHIVKTVLASSLSSKDHETLVIDALKKAKQEGVI